MSRARLFLALGLLLLLVTPVLGLPVTITRTGGSVNPPGWDRTGRAIETRVEIVTPGPGRVAVADPALVFPEVFDTAQLITSMQGFAADPASGVLASDGGGTLVIEGVFGDLDVNVEQEDGSGEIRVTRTTPLGTQEWIRSAETQPGWVRMQLPTPSSTLVSQRLSLLRPFNAPTGTTVTIGSRRVHVEQGRVSATALATTGLAAVLQGWLAHRRCQVIFMICWAVGTLAVEA